MQNIVERSSKDDIILNKAELIRYSRFQGYLMQYSKITQFSREAKPITPQTRYAWHDAEPNPIISSYIHNFGLQLRPHSACLTDGGVHQPMEK